MKLTDPASFGLTLKDLLRTDSERILAEPAYLKARLSDRAPQASRQISVLVESLPAGIPQALRASPAKASLRKSLSSKLQNERGLSAEAADWVVDCWASALDVKFVPDPTKDERKTPPFPYPRLRSSSSIVGPLLLAFCFWVRPWNAVSYTKGEGLHWNQDWHLPWTAPPKPQYDFNFKPILPKIDDNSPALQPLTRTNGVLPATDPLHDSPLLGNPNLVDDAKCWFQIGTNLSDKCALSNLKGWDGREARVGTSEILLRQGRVPAEDIYGAIGENVSVSGPSASCKPGGEWYSSVRVASGSFPLGVSMSDGGIILGQPLQAGDSTVTLVMDNVRCNGNPYYGLQQTLNFHIAASKFEMELNQAIRDKAAGTDRSTDNPQQPR